MKDHVFPNDGADERQGSFKAITDGRHRRRHEDDAEICDDVEILSPGPDVQPDGMPEGFILTQGGVYRAVSAGDCETEHRWVCGPLCVAAMVRDARNSGWARLIEIIDRDGALHELMVPEADLDGSGKRLRGILRSHGLKIAPGKVAAADLMDLLVAWEPSARIRVIDALGWVDASFTAFALEGSRVLGAASDRLRLAEGTAGTDCSAADTLPRGTLADWQREVAGRSVGNVLMIVAISLSFAAPLVELIGRREGAGLHLGGTSGSGKSTIQAAANSVWRRGDASHSWSATTNALEGIAATRNGTLLTLDELKRAAARDVDQAMFQLANGTGKARANARGRALSIQSWKITVLSSGETSLARHLANGGIEIQPGQEARFLEIPADGRAHRSYDALHGAASHVDFAKALSGAANAFHGTAGPAFVTWILEDPERALRDCAQLMKLFEDLAAGLLGRCEDFIVPRAMGTFALIAAAGELATAAGITGWKRDDAMTAALEAAELWIDGRLAPGRAAQHASILRTRDFLKAHGTTRFLRVGAAGPVAKLAGWRDDHAFYVLPDIWRALHAGFDASQAARHLANAGMLRPGGRDELQNKAPRSVRNRPRVYTVSARILDWVPTESA